MNVLKAIIERLNQKLDASNLFPSLYGIAAPDPNNAKSFLAYDGKGQNLITADYDKTDGTCFWTLRGSVSVRKNDGVQVKACQDMYVTTFPLRAYTVIKKTALPCDSNATEGYVMDMFFKYVQGKDTALRNDIGVTDIYFRPVGVVSNTPDLPKQFEYVTLYFDLDVEVTAQLIEGCYDECGVNPIPLPDGSCPPINRVVSVTGLDTDNTDPSRPIVKISVDGSTITGQGTPDDPLVAIGGGGGGSLRVQDEGITVTNAATTLNFTGNVTASLASAGNVTVNVPAPTAQVNSDWNATSGVAEILNKPTIPAAQVNSDWNASSGVAEILNKPTIPSINGLVPYTGATADVDLGANGLTAHDLTISHPSGSGVAVSVTKGGAGEALTVVKSSGSGNAASITGGVTLIDELHLNTDLSDTYIASAATWNAKQDALSAGTGISLASNTITNTAPDQTVVLNEGVGIDVTGTYPNFTIANTLPGYNLYKDLNNQTAVTGNTNNNKVVSVLIPANTITVGSIVNIKVRAGKTGGAGIFTIRIYANTADSIVSPAPTLLMTSATTAIGNTYNGCDRNAIVKSATVTQTAQANASIQNDAVVGNATLTNSNVDWTVDQYIIFAIQNGANGDSVTMSYYEIEIK